MILIIVSIIVGILGNHLIKSFGYYNWWSLAVAIIICSSILEAVKTFYKGKSE